jgi:non-canonical poly(A) RNA polymerase PAPD5/7
MMIVSYLQMKQRTSHFNSQVPSWNLGTLLLEFFHLYGISFNYYSTGVRIAEGGSYLQKRRKEAVEGKGGGMQRPNLLYIENPDVPDFDIGRNSFMMPKIRRSFEHAHQLLTAALVDPTVPSYLAYVVRPDDPALMDRPGPELSARRSNALALYGDSDEEVEEVEGQGSSGKAKKRRKG